MYLWQRLAAVSWLIQKEQEIRAESGNDLAIIERPGRQRVILEISCRTRSRAQKLQTRFGGRVIKLPRDWLVRFARNQKTKPLHIGKRLVVSNVAGGSDVASAARRWNTSPARTLGQRPRPYSLSHIVIPAGAAFGTGQHPTTAMSLRMLEQLTRTWNAGWSMLDLGTGSGIFALAASRFDAERIIAVDIDPVAISTAKANAKLNHISDVQFKVADVLRWQIPKGIDLVTANLFSELLIAVAPKLQRIPRLIISGVMREQEREVTAALRRNGFTAQAVRRRGKWIAIWARNKYGSAAPSGDAKHPSCRRRSEAVATVSF